jgi:RNA recognition motif-containing protein
VRKTLYIGNFRAREDAGELRRLVSAAGKVLHFKMMLHDDEMLHRHGGFAVVELETEEDAAAVARTLHGTPFHGTALEVRPATAREETASGHPRMFGTMNMGDDGPPPPEQP